MSKALGIELKQIPFQKWKSQSSFIFNHKNAFYEYEINTKKLQKLVGHKEEAQNVDFNAKTNRCAFTHKNNLYIASDTDKMDVVTHFSNKNIVYDSGYKSSVATKSEVNKFLNFIIKGLDKKGFLQPNHKRQSMIRNINNIFHRLNLSEQEIRILLGIFSTLNEFNKKS